jgi:hypothetical protein
MKMREVVLACYSDDASSIAMSAEQAVLYAEAYKGMKLVCSVRGPEAEAIINRGHVPVAIVEVKHAQLKPTSAEAGHVIGFCEILAVEGKRHQYKKGA